MSLRCLLDGHIWRETNIATANHPTWRVICARCGKTHRRGWPSGGFR